MNDYLALTLVSGSRSWTAADVIADRLLEAWHDARQDGYAGITVMEGGAPGADTIAGRWADQHLDDGVGHQQIKARWETCAPDCRPGHRRTRGTREHCPTAGHRRNQQMVDHGPLILLAFRHASSTGTGDCITRAKAAGIPVIEVTA